MCVLDGGNSFRGIRCYGKGNGGSGSGGVGDGVAVAMDLSMDACGKGMLCRSFSGRSAALDDDYLRHGERVQQQQQQREPAWVLIIGSIARRLQAAPHFFSPRNTPILVPHILATAHEQAIREL